MTITIDGPNETIEHDGELSIDGDSDIDIESLNLSEVFSNSVGSEGNPVESIDAQTVRTEEANDVREAQRLANSGTGTEADPWKIDNSIFDGAKTVKFSALGADRSTYEANQLQMPNDVDWKTTNVNLKGDSVRHATIKLEDNASLGSSEGLVRWADPEGQGANFGSIRGLRLHGNRDNNTGGNIVYKPSGPAGEVVIDIVIDDCIIRYGADRGIRLQGNASGSRIRNSWIEHCDSWLLHLNGGNRLKITNNHFVGGSMAAMYDMVDSHAAGNSYRAARERGVWVAGHRNRFIGEDIIHNPTDTTDEALRVEGNDNWFSACSIRGDEGRARVNGNGNVFYGYIEGNVRIDGDNNDFTGADIGGTVEDNGTGNTW